MTIILRREGSQFQEHRMLNLCQCLAWYTYLTS